MLSPASSTPESSTSTLTVIAFAAAARVSFISSRMPRTAFCALTDPRSAPSPISERARSVLSARFSVSRSSRSRPRLRTTMSTNNVKSESLIVRYLVTSSWLLSAWLGGRALLLPCPL